jgi:hypothetical protein
MEPMSIPPRPDVVATITTPRVTPTPRENFSSVLARGVARGAASAASLVPGVPLVALAVRGGISGVSGPSTTASAMPLSLASNSALSSAAGTAEGPASSVLASASTPASTVSSLASAASGTTTGDGGVESSIQQSQEMNMYFLQIQQQVDAQNRTFTTLSNVLKAQSDTVKNAIGNIH